MLGQAKRGRQERALEVRRLARDPDGQLLAALIPARDAAARLHRVADQPLVDDPQADDLVRAPHRRLDRVPVADLGPVGDVVAPVVVQLRRVRLERFLHVDDGRQLLVVDLDRLGAVLSGVARLGDHERDRVADLTHLAVAHQRVAADRLDAGDVAAARDRLGEVAELARGVDRDDAGELLRRRAVDRPDAAVRDRGAVKRGVEGVDQPDVVGVLRAPGDQAGVFDALDPRADHSHQRHRSTSKARWCPASDRSPTAARRSAARGSCSPRSCGAVQRAVSP